MVMQTTEQVWQKIGICGKAVDLCGKPVKSRKAERIRVCRVQEIGFTTTRYHLSNGWFIDHETAPGATEYGEPYGGSSLEPEKMSARYALILAGR